MTTRIVNKVPAMIAQWAGGEPGRYTPSSAVLCHLCTCAKFLTYPSDGDGTSAINQTQRSTRMRFSFAVFVLLLAPGLLGAQTPDQATEREIQQLERAYNEARLANDIAALNRMTTADYFAISARGTTREVGNQRNEPVNVTPSGVMEESEIRNMRVRVYGDSAVSTYEQRVSGRQNDGAAFEVKVISSHVWVRQGGQWQLALMHSTYL